MSWRKQYFLIFAKLFNKIIQKEEFQEIVYIHKDLISCSKY